jgi:protocatechuate 3,4-dioxygenase beta subunit
VLVILCALVPFVGGTGHVPEAGAPVNEAAAVRAAGANPGEAAPARREEATAPVIAPEKPPAPAAASIHGSVLDLEGRGVAGVEVHFQRDGKDADVAPARTATDGSFAMTFPAQEGGLVVSDAAWATVRRGWLARELPTEPTVVIVAPARSYRGSVVDPEGAPVAGARVVVLVDQRMVPVRAVGDKVVTLPEDLAATDTDASGRFAFPRIGWIAGARLTATHDGHAPATITLPEASSDDLLLRLGRPDDKPCIYGIVLDAERHPVAGAYVAAGTESVTTGDDGRFAAPYHPRFVPNAVRAVKPDVGAASARLMPGAAQPGWNVSQPILLQLSAGPGAVKGRVVDQEGHPVAGAAVWTPDLTWLGNVTANEQGHELSFGTSVEGMGAAEHRATGPESAYLIGTTSGADGSFTLRGLLPRSYALFALVPGSMLGAGPVAATPGESVELRIQTAALQTVAGRVVSRRGTPLANVRIGLGRRFAWQRPQREDDPWSGSPTMPAPASRSFRDGTVVTDEAGRFRFAGVQVQGTFLTMEGDAMFASAPFELDSAPQCDRLEVVVDACSRFRFELQQPDEADAFRFAGEGEHHVSLFVPVESYVMSMGQLEFAGGRTPVAFTREGEVTVILLRNGKEVRRVTVTLPAGGVHTMRL